MKNYAFRWMVLVILLPWCMGVSAQRSADHVIDFDTDVQDLIVVPFNGIVVISDENRLFGYDPSDLKKVLWSTDAPKDHGNKAFDLLAHGSMDEKALDILKEKKDKPSFTAIDDTPFIQSFFQNTLYVLNSYTGEMLFQGDAQTYYFQSEYLFEENSLLLRGIRDKALVVAKYNLQEKRLVWETLASKDFKFDFGSLFKLSSWFGGIGRIKGPDSMYYTDTDIAVIVNSSLYVFDRKGGELLWKDEGNMYRSITMLEGGKKFITLVDETELFKPKIKVDVKTIRTGKSSWKNPIEVSDVLLLEDWRDRIMIAQFKGFNFYDYETGQKIWKKAPKAKGLKKVISTGKDFIYVNKDEMMLVDKDGKKKWKKKVEVSDNKKDEVIFLEMTENGKILYVTSTYANMVDYKTGKKIWKKNIKFDEDRIVLAKFNKATREFIVFNDEKLYKFSENTKSRPKPYAKLKLKKEKLITQMDVFSDKVAITGQSEVIGVDNTGKVSYHNTYKQPGELGRKFAKFGLGALGTASSIAMSETVVSQSYTDENGQQVSNEIYRGDTFDKKVNSLGKLGYVGSALGSDSVKQRFNALQQTDTFALLFAKGDNGAKVLVKVDKESGKEVDKIIFTNNKPVYDYDPISKNIYYSINKEVRVFSGA